MGLFSGGHDKSCHCSACTSTPRGGRGAKPIKLSAKEQRRNEKFGQKNDKRNQPTKAKGGRFW